MFIESVMLSNRLILWHPALILSQHLNVNIVLNLGVEGQSVEISNIVDIRKEHNYEIAMRISSSINSQNRFYTDLNGYQVIFH